MAEFFAGGHLRFVDREWRDDDGDVVEIAPVVRGSWLNEVERHPERYGWVSLDNVVCSVCDKSSNRKTAYCSNCGARMKG